MNVYFEFYIFFIEIAIKFDHCKVSKNRTKKISAVHLDSRNHSTAEKYPILPNKLQKVRINDIYIYITKICNNST